MTGLIAIIVAPLLVIAAIALLAEYMAPEQARVRRHRRNRLDLRESLLNRRGARR